MSHQKEKYKDILNRVVKMITNEKFTFNDMIDIRKYIINLCKEEKYLLKLCF